MMQARLPVFAGALLLVGAAVAAVGLVVAARSQWALRGVEA